MIRERERQREKTTRETLTTADLATAGERPAQQLPDEEPLSDSARSIEDVGAATDEGHPAPLFAQDVAEDFREKWDAIQIGFVDDPRDAVRRADELVAQVMKRLAETFAQERATLEKQLG